MAWPHPAGWIVADAARVGLGVLVVALLGALAYWTGAPTEPRTHHGLRLDRALLVVPGQAPRPPCRGR